MSLANLKATTEYQEAIQATEDIEPPAVGFARTSDYKGVNVVIKQNNTLLYLASKQSQKLIELEEKFDRLKQRVHTIIEKEIQPADLEDSISSLAKRLDNFSISVVLRDTRWEDNRQIITTMEVDLSAGTQLVYTFPDMILSVNDFHNHVEVAIQTHGYDTWQGGESNLLITMALTGRLSNTSYMGFQYSVENVVDHLTTNGITAIPDERRSIEELEGMSWNLKPHEQTSVRVPSRVAVNERLNRSGSGGKNLVIQEKFAQNQQDFLDEYLPQWDDQLATRKQRSELEWENPFAVKRGEDHTVLHISKNEEKDDDLPYPKFRKFQQLAAQIIKKHEEHAFPTAADDAESSTSYQPPTDAIMGPAVYPPARQNPQQAYKPDYQLVILKEKAILFMEDMVSTTTQMDTATGMDGIRSNACPTSRSRPMAKLAFVENLLGESEKLMWQQWRTAYPGAYSALETISDDPQNITSQVRQLIIMEDPYRGSTDEQDRATLERVTAERFNFPVNLR
nr:TPA: orf y [Tanacetum cinerariifolium]